MLDRFTPVRLTPLKLACDRSLLERLAALDGSALDRFTPIAPSEKMVLLSKVAELKSALERLTPERFVPVKSE